MNYIDFVVRNKHIESRQNAIIADNTDYMMRFAFDEGWDGYPDKTVLVLDNEGKIWELHLTGGAAEVKLPKFIGRKLLAVGVTATAGDGEISTDAVSLRVNPSIRTGASEVIESPESGAMDMLEEYREKYDTLIAELQAAIDSTYLGVTGAKVGQTVRITAVDEGGNPTEWEAVEFPEQVQSDYEQNDSSAKDYIKNRPFYDSTETTDISGTFVTIAASGSSVTHDFIPLQVGQEWKVTTNTGSEFTVVVQENEQGEPCLGSPDTTSGSYPFYIRANEAVCNSSWVLMQNITSLTVTCLSGTYTQIVTKKIDSKFLPDVGSSLVVNLTMDDSGNITADKTFAEIKAASDDGKVVNAKFKGTIVPLGHLTDSEAIFTLTKANSSEVSTGSFTCTSNNVWSMLQDGFRITAGYSLGISGASVGQIVKIKTVDESGVPTEWEAVTNSTPFIVEFSGDGSTAYTSSHTFEQIIDAISAGRYVVGHAEELMVSGDPAYARYNIYFDLVDTMDLATFKFVDTGNSYQISIFVYPGGVDLYGSYLSASSSTYGGVKADSAEETDTQPVRIGTDGKLYTAQVQPDWDQNNSSQPDYIKNRTHKREEVLVPSFTLSGTAEATNEGATVKEFTVNSKIGEAPTGMSVYCRINGQPPVLLPKIHIPDYIIYEYSTYGYGDPSVFSSSAYVEGAPSVHDNGLDIGVGDDRYKWIIKVSRDSQYFDYEELTLEFGTSFETVYTPLDENYIPMTVPRVAAASAGDILRVKAVDDHGKPTEWEAADAASGEDWEFINEISTNEWISSVTINQDSNGNPFSLKKMRIFMTLPKTTNEAGEEQSNAGYAYYAVNGMRPAWQNPSNGWNNALFLWTIEALGDYYTVTCFKDGGNGAELWHSDIFKSEGAFSTITKFEWRLFNGTMGWSSTNFKVYGVKA